MRRHLPCLLLSGLCAFAASCGDDTTNVAVSLRDPQGLIDMVSPARLRVLAIPVSGGLSGTTYSCDAMSGRVSPEPSTVDGAMIADAKADIVVDIHSSIAETMLSVPADDYILLVRGRGTDRVTMVPNTVIATACAHQMIGAGETQTVNLTLVEIAGVGTCGDGTLSPDEQCDDHNTAGGDGCSSSCETEPLFIDTTAAGGGQHPSASWAPGGRAAVAFQRPTDTAIRVRLLNETGGTIMISGLGALAVDQALLASGIDHTSPTQDQPTVSATGGRIGCALLDIAAGNFDVAARFRDFDLTTPAAPDIETVVTEMAPAAAQPTSSRTANAMTQQNPAIAAMSDGTTLVAFENAGATTGISGRVYAAAPNTTPSGTAAFNLGMGSGNAQPAVAVVGSQFVVAYATSSAIFVQKVSTAGAPTAPMMLASGSITPTATATVHQVAIAAMSPCPATGGCAIVAWHDTGAMSDGDGSIRAQLLDGTGAAMGTAFAVNSSTSGDQTGPAAAAGNMRFVVAFQDADGIHARNFDGTGMPALNRSRTPPASTDDYLLAPAGSTFPALAVGGTASSLLAAWQTAAPPRIQSRTIPLP